MKQFSLFLITGAVLFASCGLRTEAHANQKIPVDQKISVEQKIPEPVSVNLSADIPSDLPVEIAENIRGNADVFLADLAAVRNADIDGLLILADKKHYLDSGFEPSDLVELEEGRSYAVNRAALKLRMAAEKSLELMAAVAKKDGVTLAASSAYRSYAYQKTVYERNVRELGLAAADRESARPGTSQHQLGTAVDFGSITDAFANTAASKWLTLHAGEFGWSLSFPEGYEAVTGYRWESWHYRFIGIEAAKFQKKWFGNIQQYMIECVHTLNS